MPKRKTVVCHSCGEDIYVGQHPKIGNFVTCRKCCSQFEIIDLDPVLVDWPYYDDEESYGDEEDLD